MIGDRIRQRRIDLELTQANLAEMTNIKKNTISNYENNVSSPSEENILKLMQALKCDANYLFKCNKIDEFILSSAEQRSIIKYRSLDEFGKKTVDCTLDIQYERCNSEKQILSSNDKIFTAKSAAFGGDNKIYQITEKQYQKALDMLEDDENDDC
jgi:transcriptional regulator with XRE-family HTH domain